MCVPARRSSIWMEVWRSCRWGVVASGGAMCTGTNPANSRVELTRLGPTALRRHLWTRLAFRPWASAIRATDAPGCGAFRQYCSLECLAVSSAWGQLGVLHGVHLSVLVDTIVSLASVNLKMSAFSTCDRELQRIAKCIGWGCGWFFFAMKLDPDPVVHLCSFAACRSLRNALVAR